ncbi:hypothetical protein E2562_006209, partial [Oryza meyeriana var. granulata]
MAGGDRPTAAVAAAEEWLGEFLLLPLRWPSSAELLAAWGAVRAEAVAPALVTASAACLALSAMLLADAVFMAAASFARRRRPDRRYRATPLGVGDDDEEAGRLAYPMVLVQIPMYNEREVYKLSIGAACGLSWPLDRLIIQVLDDSMDPTVK